MFFFVLNTLTQRLIKKCFIFSLKSFFSSKNALVGVMRWNKSIKPKIKKEFILMLNCNETKRKLFHFFILTLHRLYNFLFWKKFFIFLRRQEEKTKKIRNKKFSFKNNLQFMYCAVHNVSIIKGMKQRKHRRIR